MLLDNRRHNNICDMYVHCYREELTNMTDEEIDYYYRKIEIN